MNPVLRGEWVFAFAAEDITAGDAVTIREGKVYRATSGALFEGDWGTIPNPVPPKTEET